MRRYILPLAIVLLCTNLNGQSFILNQLFQPSIRINTLYNHDFNFLNKDQLQTGQVNINCIIPIKSQLSLKVKWKKMLELPFKKQPLKRAAKFRAYQIFWNFRPKSMYLNLAYKDSLQNHPFSSDGHFTYGVSTGITGIHFIAKPMKKQFKLLFYSLTVGMMEDQQSIESFRIPTITALVGFAHMKSLTFYWYYGLYFSYDNGQFIPAPFFGIQAKLNKRLWLNITLPVQMRLAWKLSNKLKVDFTVGLSGFSTAFGFQNSTNGDWNRYVLGDFRVRAGLNFNIKLSAQSTLYLEGGSFVYQLPSFRGEQPPFETPELSPSVYGGVSLFYAFKKSLLGSAIDGIIAF